MSYAPEKPSLVKAFCEYFWVFLGIACAIIGLMEITTFDLYQTAMCMFIILIMAAHFGASDYFFDMRRYKESKNDPE